MPRLLLGIALPWFLAAGAGASTADDRAQQQAIHELIEQGTRLEHAEGANRDFKGAHDLYCQAARAQSAEGQIRLGWMYANGRGVGRDDSIANSLFRLAAAQGSELGGRLADAIKGTEDKLPTCLTAAPKAAEQASRSEPAVSPAAPQVLEPPADPERKPTPVVVSPANLRAAPHSPEAKKWIATVLKLTAEFKLDPRLVFALIRAESNFDPLAKSSKNAQGLMQLIPETAERFFVKDILDPIDNLRGGMSYLRWLLSYFKGDVLLALAGYNAGEGAVDRHKGVPPYPETLAYVQRIRALYPMDRHPFDAKPMIVRPPTPAAPVVAGTAVALDPVAAGRSLKPPAGTPPAAAPGQASKASPTGTTPLVPAPANLPAERARRNG